MSPAYLHKKNKKTNKNILYYSMTQMSLAIKNKNPNKVHRCLEMKKHLF